MDTIKIDTIQGIRETCSTIENKLDKIVDNLPFTKSNSFTVVPLSSLEQEVLNLMNNTDDSILSESTEIASSIIIDSIHDISSELTSINDQTPQINSSESLNETPTVNRTSTLTTNKQHEFYLTKLPTNITESQIMDYIKAKGITDTTNIYISKLVKKDADLSLLSFISFKIDTSEFVGKAITDKHFWPERCSIKEFVHKSKSTQRNTNSRIAATASFDHFLVTTQAQNLQT